MCGPHRYNDDISLEDAIHTSLLTLKEGFEGQLTEKTVEIGVIGLGAAPGEAQDEGMRVHGAEQGKPPNPAFRKLTESEIKDYLSL